MDKKARRLALDTTVKGEKGTTDRWKGTVELGPDFPFETTQKQGTQLVV
jgi:hypothetical protein